MMSSLVIHSNTTSSSNMEINCVALQRAENIRTGYYSLVTSLWSSDDFLLPNLENEKHMTEDEFDAFLVENGVLDKLLSQMKATSPSRNWEDELNEL